MTGPKLQERAHRPLEVFACKQISRELRYLSVGAVRAALVQACPYDRLGRCVGARGTVGELARKRTRGFVEAFVWEHTIDHVPTLERCGVVQLTGHHQLASPRWSGTLRQALG